MSPNARRLNGGPQPRGDPDEARAAGHNSPAFTTMSPAAFAPMNGMPGVAALARDAEWRLLWCNRFYAELCGRTEDQMIGTTMADYMPAELAHERETRMKQARDNGKLVAYYQLWHGSRWFTRVWPLDPTAFGKRGVFVVIQSIAQDSTVHHHDAAQDAVVLSTGDLDELSVLSPRELEIFYHLACGLTSAEIASILFRSTRTIEQHANQIYKKLGMTSRAQVTKFAVERGIVAFSGEEWRRIVESRTD